MVLRRHPSAAATPPTAGHTCTSSCASHLTSPQPPARWPADISASAQAPVPLAPPRVRCSLEDVRAAAVNDSMDGARPAAHPGPALPPGAIRGAGVAHPDPAAFVGRSWRAPMPPLSTSPAPARPAGESIRGHRRTGAMPTPPWRSPLLGIPLLVLACHPPAPASGPMVLAAAQRAMGGTDSVRTIWSVAAVTSPTGGFETRIASAVNGDVRLALGRGLLAGVRDSRGWACDTSRTVTALDPVTRTVVRGHDLHMLVIAPSWLTPPTREPDVRWNGDSAIALRFSDELGAPLRLYLRLRDTLPLGLELVNHTGRGQREVRVRFEDWQPLHGVRLFRKATFEHGPNRFVYSYITLAVNALGTEAFQSTCDLATGAAAG